jgi:hypothetical protein
MTRAELERGVYQETGHTDAPDSRIVSRVRRFLVEGVHSVLGEPGLAHLADSDTPHVLTSVASQARYVLPESIAAVRHIADRTNERRLAPMSLAAYREIAPDPTSYGGTPTHYVPIGPVGVAVQPTNPSEVWADSTDSADVGVAYIEGLVTGGYLRKHAVTMTGASAVTFDITSFVELHDFYLSKPAIGTVTLKEDSEGGTELARITIGQTRPNYYGLYLWPTPAAEIDYYIDSRREVDPMNANTSVPPWPTDFHHLLGAYAVWREWVHQGDLNRAAEAKTRYDTTLSRMKYATQMQTDELQVMGRRRGPGFSRLGGNYPADTWGW